MNLQNLTGTLVTTGTVFALISPVHAESLASLSFVEPEISHPQISVFSQPQISGAEISLTASLQATVLPDTDEETVNLLEAGLETDPAGEKREGASPEKGDSVLISQNLQASSAPPLDLARDHSHHSDTTVYWSPSRPDSHAPIGVMGDHTHHKGEVMFSYRYMFMEMDGSRDGTDSLSDAEVLRQFPITPTRMTMQMHMLGTMYAPTDHLTLMFMLPYVSKSMDHVTRTGRRFSTDSEGIGDIQLSGLYNIFDNAHQRIHLNAGISFPTGSIEERDDTPAGPNQILPYPMQIGSGTLDLRPGITYLGQGGNWSWGAQALGTIRLGENANGYQLGNQLMLTGWGARKVTDWFSTSLRLEGRTWGNIEGRDSRLNPALIPTADPNRRAGSQLDLGFGVNFYLPQGLPKGGRLALEFKLPLYRNLDGPQLETDWQLTAGIQASL